MVHRHRQAQMGDVEFPTNRSTAAREANRARGLSDQALLRQARRDAEQWQKRLTKSKANGGRIPGMRR